MILAQEHNRAVLRNRIQISVSVILSRLDEHAVVTGLEVSVLYSKGTEG